MAGMALPKHNIACSSFAGSNMQQSLASYFRKKLKGWEYNWETYITACKATLTPIWCTYIWTINPKHPAILGGMNPQWLLINRNSTSIVWHTLICRYVNHLLIIIWNYYLQNKEKIIHEIINKHIAKCWLFLIGCWYLTNVEEPSKLS